MTSYVSPAKGLARPNREQLAAFRDQLLEQRGFRIDQLRLLLITRVRASRSSREVTATLLAGARSALRDVNAALERLDDGTFGHCTACECRLPIERLEVLPQVAMCMACQRAAEQA
jgi:RNA polymerase-binding transcription factor DksA